MARSNELLGRPLLLGVTPPPSPHAVMSDYGSPSFREEATKHLTNSLDALAHGWAALDTALAAQPATWQLPNAAADCMRRASEQHAALLACLGRSLRVQVR